MLPSEYTVFLLERYHIMREYIKTLEASLSYTQGVIPVKQLPGIPAQVRKEMQVFSKKDLDPILDMVTILRNEEKSKVHKETLILDTKYWLHFFNHVLDFLDACLDLLQQTNTKAYIILERLYLKQEDKRKVFSSMENPDTLFENGVYFISCLWTSSSLALPLFLPVEYKFYEGSLPEKKILVTQPFRCECCNKEVLVKEKAFLFKQQKTQGDQRLFGACYKCGSYLAWELRTLLLQQNTWSLLELRQHWRNTKCFCCGHYYSECDKEDSLCSFVFDYRYDETQEGFTGCKHLKKGRCVLSDPCTNMTSFIYCDNFYEEA